MHNSPVRSFSTKCKKLINHDQNMTLNTITIKLYNVAMWTELFNTVDKNQAMHEWDQLNHPVSKDYLEITHEKYH